MFLFLFLLSSSFVPPTAKDLLDMMNTHTHTHIYMLPLSRDLSQDKSDFLLFSSFPFSFPLLLLFLLLLLLLLFLLLSFSPALTMADIKYFTTTKKGPNFPHSIHSFPLRKTGV